MDCDECIVSRGALGWAGSDGDLLAMMMPVMTFVVMLVMARLSCKPAAPIVIVTPVIGSRYPRSTRASAALSRNAARVRPDTPPNVVVAML